MAKVISKYILSTDTTDNRETGSVSWRTRIIIKPRESRILITIAVARVAWGRRLIATGFLDREDRDRRTRARRLKDNAPSPDVSAHARGVTRLCRLWREAER